MGAEHPPGHLPEGFWLVPGRASRGLCALGSGSGLSPIPPLALPPRAPRQHGAGGDGAAVPQQCADYASGRMLIPC